MNFVKNNWFLLISYFGALCVSVGAGLASGGVGVGVAVFGFFVMILTWAYKVIEDGGVK